MIVGFTGTRKGMNIRQQANIRRFLLEHDVTEAHHGDCLGSDADFHLICNDMHIPVVVHPPDDDRWRAYCHSPTILEPKPYLERDRDIVAVADVLLATPKEDHAPKNLRGSGTWYTINNAVEQETPHEIFKP